MIRIVVIFVIPISSTTQCVHMLTECPTCNPTISNDSIIIVIQTEILEEEISTATKKVL